MSVWERLLIRIGVGLLHLLFAAFMLRVVGPSMLSVGDSALGEDGVLSVTFVAITPLSSTPPVSSVSIPVPVHAPNRVNGQDTLVGKSDVASIRTQQIGSEMNEQAKPTESSRVSVEATLRTVAASKARNAIGSIPKNDLLASYNAALSGAIRQKWASLTDRPFPSGCVLQLNLAVGGSVNVASANGCSLSNEDRLQLEAAALMAQPLPYAGYEDVFAPDLQLQL